MFSLRFRDFLRPGKIHKHFGQDSARDKHCYRDRPWGQTGPLPGTNWDPSLEQTGLFLFTILLKIITRMKLLFSNYLGDYSYSFQGSSELISITVTVSLFSCRMELQEIILLVNSQAFLAITVT